MIGLTVPKFKPMYFFQHPDFENNGAVGYPNDVATMYLAIPLEESESIQYASLATEDDGDFAGADCSLSGWGRLSGGFHECPLNPVKMQK